MHAILRMLISGMLYHISFNIYFVFFSNKLKHFLNKTERSIKVLIILAYSKCGEVLLAKIRSANKQKF